MKTVNKIIYFIRILAFIAHFYLLFVITHSFLNIGILGKLYLIIDIFYSIKILSEMLSREDCYKKDIVYNIMQIGLTFYLSILTYKVYHDNMFVYGETIGYFYINYGILLGLIIFILIYSYLGFEHNYE